MPGPVERRRPNLRKLMFVLPNLFTVSSIFCGIYAIALCCGDASVGDQLYRAAISIFFGTFFDAFDGRVARMTRTQSDFGVELDSLADVITFGVAPSILVYKWALAGMGTIGMLVCAVYASCGAIRLARFNVLARTETGLQRYFVGLPIPLAAGMVVSLVIALHQPGRAADEAVGLGSIALLMLVLSFLMVSTIRYRTFKDAGLNPRSVIAFVVVIAVGLFVALRGRPQLVLLIYFSFYILLGLVEEAFFGRRRRAAAAAAAEIDEPVLPAEEDDVTPDAAPAAPPAGEDEDPSPRTIR